MVGRRIGFVSFLSPIRGFFAFKHAAIQVVVDRDGGDLLMGKRLFRRGCNAESTNSLFSLWRCLRRKIAPVGILV